MIVETPTGSISVTVTNEDRLNLLLEFHQQGNARFIIDSRR